GGGGGVMGGVGGGEGGEGERRRARELDGAQRGTRPTLAAEVTVDQLEAVAPGDRRPEGGVNHLVARERGGARRKRRDAREEAVASGGHVASGERLTHGRTHYHVAWRAGGGLDIAVAAPCNGARGGSWLSILIRRDRMLLRRFSVLACGLLAVGLLVSGGSSTDEALAQGKKLKIGVVYDYTGPFAGGGSELHAL